jgi:hypothetical protein
MPEFSVAVKVAGVPPAESVNVGADVPPTPTDVTTGGVVTVPPDPTVIDAVGSEENPPPVAVTE